MKKFIHFITFVLVFAITLTTSKQSVYAVDDTTVVEITEENFPDNSFRNILLYGCNYDFSTIPATEIYYDENQDGALSEEELKKITYFIIGECKIVDLKGIEYYTSIVELGCQYNLIRKLDLSKNTELRYLNCYHNMLEGTLDLTNNKNLIGIAAHNNPALTDIVAPYSYDLETLNVENTSVSDMDLSIYSKLSSFSCGRTPISTLDFSNNPELKVVSVYNTNITSLDFENNLQLHMIDASATKINGLDVATNPELASLDISRTPIAWLHIGNNANLTVAKTDSNVSVAVAKNSFDVTKEFPGIDPEKMTIVSGGTLSGSILSGYDYSTPVVYTYDCGTSADGKVQLNVTLTLTEIEDSDDTQTPEEGLGADTPSGPQDDINELSVGTSTDIPKTDDASGLLLLTLLSLTSAIAVVAMMRRKIFSM